MSDHQLLLSIIAPLATAALLLLPLPTAVKKALAFLGFLVPAALGVQALRTFAPDATTGYAFLRSYDTGLGEIFGITLKLGLNGISLPLFLMAGIVGLGAGMYALQSKAERPALYWGLLLVMQGGLMGVFASVDVFFFYFFHEFALIATFIMVGVWGGRDRGYAAMNMTIYLTLGAMLSLLGLIALYVQSGATTFDMITLRQVLAHGLAEGGLLTAKTIGGLLLLGFGILVSLFPFHSWAPLGYGAAPSSAAMLHAGVLKKFGLYGLIQIAVPLLPTAIADWSTWLVWLALANVVVIGLVAMAQRDLKQMLGYGSVMHVGYGFLGVACLTTLGAGGAVLFMVAHGLTVALLFMLATAIHHRTGTLDMDEMGGLVKHTPVLAAFFLTAMLASIGLPGPGLLNFWAELSIFMGVYQHFGWLVALALLGVVIGAIYGLRAMGNIFYGQMTPALEKHLATTPAKDLCWCERVTALVLLLPLVGLGLWPRLISDPVNAAVTAIYAPVEAATQTARVDAPAAAIKPAR
jgi:NADH-quinone oxidoreductase subunit M